MIEVVHLRFEVLGDPVGEGTDEAEHLDARELRRQRKISVRIDSDDAAERDDRSSHIGRFSSEPGCTQVGRQVIVLELGDESDHAAIGRHEVVFVADAPVVPLQMGRDRNGHREGHATE